MSVGMRMRSSVQPACSCSECCYPPLSPQVYSEVVSKLKSAFAGVVSRIGDPLLAETLIGPLHTPAAVEAYKRTVAEIVRQGGKIEFGGKVRDEKWLHGQVSYA